MADIELVIRINKEVVEAFDKAKKENALNYYMNVYKDDLYNAIKNGTPLPKGHGELKDVDELLKMTKSYKSELGRLKADPFVKCGIETVENFIKEMSTIIEADKESEE